MEPELWPVVLTPPEAAWALERRRQGGRDRTKVVFSAKESAFKAQYLLTSEFLDFHALSVDFLGERDWRATFLRRVGDAFAPGDVITGRWTRRPGLVATAASLARDNRPATS